MKRSIFCCVLFFTANLLFGQKANVDSCVNATKDKLVKLIPEFKNTKAADDSAFAVSHSDLKTFHKKIFKENSFEGFSKEDYKKTKIGDVIGPFKVYDGDYCIYKIVDKIKSCDSVQVRHILIAYVGSERANSGVTRSKVEAKKIADSLCLVIQSGKTKMEDLVLKFTDDPGSRGVPSNLGNYGWFTPESGFVQEFKDAGFNNKKGTTLVVETQFGYHVIQVLEKSKATSDFLVGIGIDKLVITPYVDPFYNITKAEFLGGEIALEKYLTDSLRYPEKEFQNKIQGTVNVSVLLDTNGVVDSVNVWEGENYAPEFSIEAIRLIKAMPAWKPAEMPDGRKTSDVVYISVHFFLPPKQK